MKHDQDHFSTIGNNYKEGRFGYPGDLYQFLDSLCIDKRVAWDCATGNGQAAVDLSLYFEKVLASDISINLLSGASKNKKILYFEAPAENSKIDGNSIDLIVVAQAIHWFDLDLFFIEVERVLKPEGIFAFWGYTWPEVCPQIDGILNDFRTEIENYWPLKSMILHNEYKDIAVPLDPIPAPKFRIQLQWKVEAYLKHLNSWSGTKYYMEKTGDNITGRYKKRFQKEWAANQRLTEWPLILKVYRKP